MTIIRGKALLLAALIPVVITSAACAEPANFIYASAFEFDLARPLLERPDIEGVQLIYNWRMLESAEGVYDFSRIEADLAAVEALGKKLVIQLQDRFFSIGARNVPEYLLTEPKYAGGLAPQVDDTDPDLEQFGWVAVHWNPFVRERFQALLEALAGDFDGRIYAITLPETSMAIDQARDETGFNCDAYFAAELENLGAARAAFERSHVIQYANFWPCEWENDQGYMGRTFDFAVENGIGLGGPDIVPYRPGQMANSYPFFNRYKDQLSFVGMAVQEPTLQYTNPQTGRPFTREEFVEFATDYLGVDAIFWAVSTPWLQ
jgi:hypothetical protein